MITLVVVFPPHQLQSQQGLNELALHHLSIACVFPNSLQLLPEERHAQALYGILTPPGLKWVHSTGLAVGLHRVI